MDICNSISELAYLSGIELTATLDTKVGLLKAMDIVIRRTPDSRKKTSGWLRRL